MERKTGYYWVKVAGKWGIYLHDGLFFVSIEYPEGFTDDKAEAINETRILMPDENILTFPDLNNIEDLEFVKRVHKDNGFRNIKDEDWYKRTQTDVTSRP